MILSFVAMRKRKRKRKKKMKKNRVITQNDWEKSWWHFAKDTTTVFQLKTLKCVWPMKSKDECFDEFFSQPKIDRKIYFTIIIVYNTAWAYLIFYLRFFLKFFGWFHSHTHNTNLLWFVDELKRNIVSKRSITNNETTTNK